MAKAQARVDGGRARGPTIREESGERACVRWFENLDVSAVAEVGGKNASLGEMISKLRGAGLNVPDGFATTAAAYREQRLARPHRGQAGRPQAKKNHACEGRPGKPPAPPPKPTPP